MNKKQKKMLIRILIAAALLILLKLLPLADTVRVILFAAAYLVRTCLLLSERGLWWLAALSVPALILALAFRRKRCGGCEGCRGDKNEGVCRRIPPKTK